MTYTTITAVRAMSPMGDRDAYPDADITAAIQLAKLDIDQYTGTSWGNITTPAFDTFTSDVESMNNAEIRLLDIEGERILFPRTITTATDKDSNAVDFSGWVLHPHGVVRDVFTWPAGRVTVTGTAGRTDTPDETIEWAARTLTRHHLVNEHTRIPDRALTQEGELGGTIRISQPGVRYPTGVPAVDARLERYRHRHGPVF